MAEQARDWRLDPHVRTHCAKDIRNSCQFEADYDGLTHTGAVLSCLVDFRKVHRAVARSASDVRFEQLFQKNCAQDYSRFCPGTQPVRNRSLHLWLTVDLYHTVYVAPDFRVCNRLDIVSKEQNYA
jgi:hypothetical protein